MNAESKLKITWRNSLIILSMALSSMAALAQGIVTMRYDPVRVVGGQCYSLQPIYDWINLPRDDRSPRPMLDWIGLAQYKFYSISYKVYAVSPDGLLLENSGTLVSGAFNQIDYDSQPLIFLTNYPSANMLVDGQTIQFLALRIGSYTYTGSDNASHTIESYDYGTPYTPPPLTPNQIAAAKQAAKLRLLAYRKHADQAQISAVKWLLANATNGSASTQYSLAIHYLNGQGCETNREQAVYWLQKAADQGSFEASNKLATLTP